MIQDKSWDLCGIQRELGFPRVQHACRTRLAFSEAAAQKLSVEAILRGHRGCVNRLVWNENGTLLASGSDDRQILIWHYPDTQRPPLVVETEHQANIFGVKFLPATRDTQLVSGAMDCTVQLHTLDHSPLNARNAGAGCAAATGTRVRGLPVPSTSRTFRCHRGRVKCVEVEPGNPHLFWSGGEDGVIRQFDARLSTSSQAQYSSPNALIELRGKPGLPGRHLEVKSLALNRVRPHLVAVGAGDQYVRLYDRRMGALGPPRDPSLQRMEAVLKLAPPHLSLGMALTRPPSRMHVTCVGFGSRGDKLVATYHNDHVYSFDISGCTAPAVPLAAACPAASAGPSACSSPDTQLAPPRNRTAALDFFRGAPSPLPLPPRHGLAAAGRGAAGEVGGGGAGEMWHGEGPQGGQGSWGMLPVAAEKLRAEGNLHFHQQEYLAAVTKYSGAVRLAPADSTLYTNRALALVRRGWEGDGAAALRDCETALGFDPSNARCHFRRVQALQACGLLKAASAACRLYRRAFPQEVDDGEFVRLEEQIAAELTQRTQQEEARRQQRAARREARRRQGLNLERVPSRRQSSPRQQQQQPGPHSAAMQREAASQQVGWELAEGHPLAPLQAQQGQQLSPPLPPNRDGRDTPAAAPPGSPRGRVEVGVLPAAATSAPAGTRPPGEARLEGAGGPHLQQGAPRGARYQAPAPAGDEAYPASGDAHRTMAPVAATALAGTAGARTAVVVSHGAASPVDGGAPYWQGGSLEGGAAYPGPQRSSARAAPQAGAAQAPGGGEGAPGRGMPTSVGEDAAGGDPAAAAATSPGSRFLRLEEGEGEGGGVEDSDPHHDWMDVWGEGGSSDGEEREAGGEGDVDQQYADALDRAYREAVASPTQPQHNPGGVSAATAEDLPPEGCAGTMEHSNRFIGPPPPAAMEHSNGFIGPPPPAATLPSLTPSLWNATEGGRRMLQRYVGQCNVQTDIKEATFLGPNDELVACGSDDGHVFIFSSATGECIRVLKADGDVANCVQGHPHLPVLATSGIEHTIKVWSPESVPSAGGNLQDIISSTQDAMRRDPYTAQGVDPQLLMALNDDPRLLRTLLRSVTRMPGAPLHEEREEERDSAGEAGDGEREGEDEEGPQVTCRVT